MIAMSRRTSAGFWLTIVGIALISMNFLFGLMTGSGGALGAAVVAISMLLFGDKESVWRDEKLMDGLWLCSAYIFFLLVAFYGGFAANAILQSSTSVGEISPIAGALGPIFLCLGSAVLVVRFYLNFFLNSGDKTSV
jgi:hypothetical protein